MKKNRLYSLIAASFVLAALCCGCRSTRFDVSDGVYRIPYRPAQQDLSSLLDDPVWDDIQPSVGFSAPWDGLSDSTSFKCFATESHFCFRFDVSDTTLVLTEDYKDEGDVGPEDRVELFFSPTGRLRTYVGTEMDPAGHALDYICKFYRKFDYGWNFSTLTYDHEIRPEGYSVAGSVTRKELKGKGVNLDKGFMIGVFRADFRKDGSVVWYSLKKTSDERADFHQPSVFFKAKTDR